MEGKTAAWKHEVKEGAEGSQRRPAGREAIEGGAATAFAPARALPALRSLGLAVKVTTDRGEGRIDGHDRGWESMAAATRWLGARSRAGLCAPPAVCRTRTHRCFTAPR